MHPEYIICEINTMRLTDISRKVCSLGNQAAPNIRTSLRKQDGSLVLNTGAQQLHVFLHYIYNVCIIKTT